jgi:hypothetical protein
MSAHRRKATPAKHHNHSDIMNKSEHMLTDATANDGTDEGQTQEV